MQRERTVTRDQQRLSDRRRRVGKSLFPITWKPASLGRGTLLLVLPQSAEGVIGSVRLLSRDGRKILARGVVSRLSGSGRLQVEFFRSGASLPAPCLLEMQLAGGGKRRRVIARPQTRMVVR